MVEHLPAWEDELSSLVVVATMLLIGHSKPLSLLRTAGAELFPDTSSEYHLKSIYPEYLEANCEMEPPEMVPPCHISIGGS